jgi:ABC-type transport system substrate-binding protein
VSQDGKLTYTFTLRPGVKFHNGKPLTSADVAGSFDRYKPDRRRSLGARQRSIAGRRPTTRPFKHLS